jgi:hypothetical protein
MPENPVIPEDEPEAASPKAEQDAEAEVSREKLIVDIWKQAVDTQKHFNDMCVKSRQLGLTFVAASLGAALYLFIRTAPAESEGGSAAKSIYAYGISVCGQQVVFHVSLAIILVAAAAVFAVRRLDLGVYHQMLRGAVTFGEDLEERHIRHLVNLRKGMTQTISHFSRHSDAAVKKSEDGRYDYLGEDQRNAGEKLRSFYNFVFIFLAGLALLVFIASNYLKAIG